MVLNAQKHTNCWSLEKEAMSNVDLKANQAPAPSPASKADQNPPSPL